MQIKTLTYSKHFYKYEMWLIRMNFDSRQVLPSIKWLTVTLDRTQHTFREKVHFDRFTFEHLKNTKMCFTTWGLNIFAVVQEGEDGEYTEF